MVVDEKGLLKAMKAAYKTAGYKVAVDLENGCDKVILSTDMWTVVIDREELPCKVLGMIAEHLREIPEPGTAFHVKNHETQAEMFNIVVDALQHDFTQTEKVALVRKINLTWGGYSLWQGANDKQVVKVSPDFEDLMLWSGKVVQLIEGNMLMIGDSTSRAYICCTTASATEQELLAHLSKVEWPYG